MGRTGISQYGIHRYVIFHRLITGYGGVYTLFFSYAIVLRSSGLIFTLPEPPGLKNDSTAIYIYGRMCRTGADMDYLIVIYLHRNREVTME